jgi:glycosyltransferase involved in cell wall biosynthesis
VLAGRDDGYLIELQRQLIGFENSTRIIEGLYGEELQSFYQESACFVFTPQYFEETSTAALEALSHGLPVVTTKEADIPFLEKYEAGRIVHRRKNEIERAVRYVLKNQKHMKNNAKKTY